MIETDRFLAVFHRYVDPFSRMPPFLCVRLYFTIDQDEPPILDSEVIRWPIENDSWLAIYRFKNMRSSRNNLGSTGISTLHGTYLTDPIKVSCHQSFSSSAFSLSTHSLCLVDYFFIGAQRIPLFAIETCMENDSCRAVLGRANVTSMKI